MKQTAVEWLKGVIDSFGNKHELQMSWSTLDEIIEQAKEMEEQQSQLYATFCLRCINEKLPVIRFEDWIKLEGDNK
jgi:glucose-6-phosphate 1-dehydrogenase